MTTASWYQAIGHLDFELAMEAVGDARRNATIDYIEPKHIQAHADAILRRRENEERSRQARLPRPERPMFAPKPDNWDAMVAAFQSNDDRKIAIELDKYRDQCRRAGYSDQYIEDNNLDPRYPRGF